MHLKIPSAKWWPFCPWRDELNTVITIVNYNTRKLRGKNSFQNEYRNQFISIVKLTHWNPATHICAIELDRHFYGLVRERRSVARLGVHHPKQCRPIVNWTLRNKRSENWTKIPAFSFNKIYFKMSAKFQPFEPGSVNSSPLVPHICASESGQHWCWIGDKPLSKPALGYCQLDP